MEYEIKEKKDLTHRTVIRKDLSHAIIHALPHIREERIKKQVQETTKKRNKFRLASDDSEPVSLTADEVAERREWALASVTESFNTMQNKTKIIDTMMTFAEAIKRNREHEVIDYRVEKQFVLLDPQNGVSAMTVGLDFRNKEGKLESRKVGIGGYEGNYFLLVSDPGSSLEVENDDNPKQLEGWRLVVENLDVNRLKDMISQGYQIAKLTKNPENTYSSFDRHFFSRRVTRKDDGTKDCELVV